jgi:uncharacterized protein with HEPN domain
MSKRQLKLYFNDINDAISAIQTYTADLTYEEFQKDRKTREAIILNFVIMGEAIKKIPADISDRYPSVPWKEFAGMRDKLVHEYFQISSEIMWETIEHDLPPLADIIVILLKEYS